MNNEIKKPNKVEKKPKKVKSTLSTKKINFIIKYYFIEQVFRKDILANMLMNKYSTGKELFELIMKENKEELNDERRQGWIFESLCEILIILKCIENINYTEICNGQIQNLKQINNVNYLLKVKIDGGGNNVVDMSIKEGNTLIDNFIEFINAEILLSPRQQLIKKLHQKMAEIKFRNSFLANKHKMWCIAHKPRSGKVFYYYQFLNIYWKMNIR